MRALRVLYGTCSPNFGYWGGECLFNFLGGSYKFFKCLMVKLGFLMLKERF